MKSVSTAGESRIGSKRHGVKTDAGGNMIFEVALINPFVGGHLHHGGGLVLPFGEFATTYGRKVANGITSCTPRNRHGNHVFLGRTKSPLQQFNLSSKGCFVHPNVQSPFLHSVARAKGAQPF